MQHLYKLYFQVLQGMRINCQSLEPGGKTRTVFHITLLPALRYIHYGIHDSIPETGLHFRHSESSP